MTWRWILCLLRLKHRWSFHHDAVPPIVRCIRCGEERPMPYGDQRLEYLL